jgi:poly(3-hydroxyalkanoate) synthetase
VNLVRGARHFVSDASHPPRLPALVDTSEFAVGENLATTPGSVVLRTEVFELIHYALQIEQASVVPLLFVPPTINKYYVLGLAPRRSMVEHTLAGGKQVFMISWRGTAPCR